MLTCHVLIDEDHEPVKDSLLNSIQSLIKIEFGIHHLTIQLESHCAESETIHCDLNRITNGELPSNLTHTHPSH